VPSGTRRETASLAASVLTDRKVAGARC